MSNKYLYGIVTGYETGPIARMIKAFLFIPSLFYGLGVWLINLGYQIKVFRPARLPKPVISVGNITAGGTGKTPFVVYLACYFRARNHRPAILTRGYMEHQNAPSDEAELMKRFLGDTPVYVSPDRVASAAKAMEAEHKPNLFILDDGFQHRKVARDLDIVLIDATNPFGSSDWLLPYGTLREPPEALRRADVVVITKTDLAEGSLAELRTELIRINPKINLVDTVHAPTGLQEMSATGWKTVPFELLKRPVVATSGIATPDSFISLLKRLGAVVTHHENFLDHHDYSAEDIARLVSECEKYRTNFIVTTQKDAVKLERFHEHFRSVRVLALAIEIKVIRGEYELHSRLDRLLSA